LIHGCRCDQLHDEQINLTPLKFGVAAVIYSNPTIATIDDQNVETRIIAVQESNTLLLCHYKDHTNREDLLVIVCKFDNSCSWL
jgi:hypothetical protein